MPRVPFFGEGLDTCFERGVIDALAPYVDKIPKLFACHDPGRANRNARLAEGGAAHLRGLDGNGRSPRPGARGLSNTDVTKLQGIRDRAQHLWHTSDAKFDIQRDQIILFLSHVKFGI